jgi:ribosome-binding factor A
MSSRRMARVNELLLQEISRFVVERQDPDIGFVTFTGVDTTDDLMEAKVFYSVLGSEEEKERTAAALRALVPELRGSMRHLESLKRIPLFHFIFDDSPARASRVFELLEKIHHEEDAPAEDKPVRRRRKAK